LASPELQLQVERLLDVERVADARRLLAPAIAQAPDDAELQFLLARAAWIDEDTVEAEQHLRRVLAGDPEHVGARLLLSQVAQAAERYAEAEQLIVDLIREYPDRAELLASYARLMLITGYLDKADRLTREALRRDPDSEGALLVRTLLAAARGQHDAAHETLAELIARDPEAEHLARALFYLLVKDRRFREAEKIGQQLLRSRPNDNDLVEALIELRQTTHWAAIPAYPFIRFGWAGVAGVWIVGMIGSRILAQYSQTAAGWFSATYIGLCIYSWIYPGLLRRWIRARGM
jgi:tetratricopeptide (TPR) repeat protein